MDHRVLKHFAGSIKSRLLLTCRLLLREYNLRRSERGQAWILWLIGLACWRLSKRESGNKSGDLCLGMRQRGRRVVQATPNDTGSGRSRGVIWFCSAVSEKWMSQKEHHDRSMGIMEGEKVQRCHKRNAQNYP
jgi:hypothetical protein